MSDKSAITSHSANSGRGDSTSYRPYFISMASSIAFFLMYLQMTRTVGVNMVDYIDAKDWTTWFSGTDPAVVYTAFIIGILLVLFVMYVLEFEDYKKRKDNVIAQFDMRYAASFLISAVIAAAIAYFVIFFGIDIFYNPKTAVNEEGAMLCAVFNPFLVFLTCFTVGAVNAYVIDTYVCHRITDGMITANNNSKKKSIINQGLTLTKDPVTMAKITEKAAALGLTDKVKVDKLGLLVSGVDDPSFATYVQILKKQ